MSNENYVVVFPSLFAENKLSLLMANIKKILKIKNQNYSKISKDGNLILVDANDPVFASTTINLLFGIKQIIIAKKIKNDFTTVVNEISKMGTNLLLKGLTTLAIIGFDNLTVPVPAIVIELVAVNSTPTAAVTLDDKPAASHWDCVVSPKEIIV